MAVAPEVRGSLGEGVPGAWIAPPEPRCWLMLAHGAGAGMDHPFLVGFCRGMAERGIATARFEFRYMQIGRRSPDPESALRSRWLEAFEGASVLASGLPVLAGGKSLGGRIASMCVADGMPAAGLVFLGYPLHPPGKPERIRVGHLDRISVPMLFLQGTADPFARSDLLGTVVERLGARAELVPIEAGDHSFNVRGRKRDPREVGEGLAEIAAPFALRVSSAA